MSKIPTAEEFFKETSPNDKYGLTAKLVTLGMKKMIYQIMVRFAKLHVQEALKTADNSATVEVVDWESNFDSSGPKPIYGVNSESILDAYPLENIQ